MSKSKLSNKMNIEVTKQKEVVEAAKLLENTNRLMFNTNDPINADGSEISTDTTFPNNLEPNYNEEVQNNLQNSNFQINENELESKSITEEINLFQFNTDINEKAYPKKARIKMMRETRRQMRQKKLLNKLIEISKTTVQYKRKNQTKLVNQAIKRHYKVFLSQVLPHLNTIKAKLRKYNVANKEVINSNLFVCFYKYLVKVMKNKNDQSIKNALITSQNISILFIGIFEMLGLYNNVENQFDLSILNFSYKFLNSSLRQNQISELRNQVCKFIEFIKKEFDNISPKKVYSKFISKLKAVFKSRYNRDYKKIFGNFDKPKCNPFLDNPLRPQHLVELKNKFLEKLSNINNINE